MVSLSDLQAVDWQERAIQQLKEQEERKERDRQRAVEGSFALVRQDLSRIKLEESILSIAEYLETKSQANDNEAGPEWRNEAFRERFFHARRELTPPSGRRPSAEQIFDRLEMPRSTGYDYLRRCGLKVDSENPDGFPD